MNILCAHLLDVVIVGSDTTVTSVNVPPPVLSDHSMIDVTLDLRCAYHHGCTSVTCRVWRSFSYDDFERDLQQSSLVCSPPSDVNELVTAYDDTLTSLLDVHAPYRAVRRSTWIYLCSDARSSNSHSVLPGVYRPDSQPLSSVVFDELSSVFEQLMTLRCPVVVCGNFNIWSITFMLSALRSY